MIELNPITREIVWEYKAEPPTDFFTRVMGSALRLPNGNTMITSSNQRRIFEVTTNGEVVWEFYSPQQWFSHEEAVMSIKGIRDLGNGSVKIVK